MWMFGELDDMLYIWHNVQCLVVLYTASQNVLKCAQHLFSSVPIEPEEFFTWPVLHKS